jgi:hypothetical protein
MSISVALQGSGVSTKLGLIKFLIDNCESDLAPNESAQPDPSWDYHETWTALHQINLATTEAIKLISGVEVASSATDEALLRLLLPELNRLEEIINGIPQ